MGRLSYVERLLRLGLYPLEFRRRRGNLIETVNVLRGIDKVSVESMFPRVDKSRIMGHCLKIIDHPFKI